MLVVRACLYAVQSLGTNDLLGIQAPLHVSGLKTWKLGTTHRFPHLNHAKLSGLTLRSVLCVSFCIELSSVDMGKTGLCRNPYSGGWKIESAHSAAKH